MPYVIVPAGILWVETDDADCEVSPSTIYSSKESYHTAGQGGQAGIGRACCARRLDAAGARTVRLVVLPGCGGH